MKKEQYIQFHKDSCQKLIDITAKKNADYTGVSDDAFANFRQIAGLVGPRAGNMAGTGTVDMVAVGFVTRMSDKLSRVGSFVSKGELMVKDESVQDTLLDLANYCILFAGYLNQEAYAAQKQRPESP